MCQRHAILPQQLWHNLTHLHHAEVLPNTLPMPRSKGEETSLHPLQIVRPALDPSLGTKLFRLREHSRVIMHDPRVDAEDCPSWDMQIADIDAAGWDVALEQESRAGVHAYGFLDNGLCVGQMGRGFPVADRISQFAGLLRSVDLANYLVHLGRVAHQVVEDGAQSDGGRVAACEDVAGGVDDDVAGIEFGRVGFFGRDPLR